MASFVLAYRDGWPVLQNLSFLATESSKEAAVHRKLDFGFSGLKGTQHKQNSETFKNIAKR